MAITHLVLYAGRHFGRFAVFVFVLPALAIFLAWLSQLDSYPAAVLATGILVIPMITMGIVLLIGMLFAGFRRIKVKGVPKETAPGIWTLWESIAGEKRANRTTIVLSGELNASVQEERLLFGIFGRRIFLTLGLPLLAVTDEKALAAILAHEDAHVRNKDTNGSLNLAEFANTFEVIFDYAPPGETVTGSLFHWLLGPLAASVEREEIRLSREAEIKADRHAASTSDPFDAARALLLVAAASQLFEEKVYRPLERELLGAVTPPRPPLERMLEAAGELSDRETFAGYARNALSAEHDETSDHPSWAERMNALGYVELPPMDALSTSALGLLESSFVAAQTAEFDDKWKTAVADHFER